MEKYNRLNINKRASDIERLVQCCICARNPADCNADENDEDDRGMCKLYVKRKGVKHGERKD